MSTSLVSALLGSAAVLVLFGPQLLAKVRGLGSRPATPAPAGDDGAIQLLAALLQLRRHLASDPKATEAIDTILTPAVLRESSK
jgi:hypothetical protein